MMVNRVAAHLNCYHTHGLEEGLRGIASAGFRYVELSAEHVPPGASGRDLGRCLRLLNDLDLIAISYSGHSDLTTRAGLRDGVKALEACARLGLPILITMIGDGDMARFMTNIDSLARHAAEHNVVVAIEVHGKHGGSGAQLAEIVQRVDNPNVRINYDTANVEFYAGVPAVEDLPLALPLIAHCHVKDKAGGLGVWNFPALGKGHVDFPHLFRLFRRSSYAGPFSVEIEFACGLWPDVPAITRALRQSQRYLKAIGVGTG